MPCRFPGQYRGFQRPQKSVCAALYGAVKSFGTAGAEKRINRFRHLKVADRAVYEILRKEEKRQKNSINMIASENFASMEVQEALGSCFTNKYSEGYPGKRYYGGTQHIDELERLCQRRALEAFNLDPQRWGVNVQPYSGSVANLEVYSALLRQNEKIIALGLYSGGHLSHGFFMKDKNVNITSKFFNSLHYDIDPETMLIDYEGAGNLIERFYPKLVIMGASAYPRDWDYGRICDMAKKISAKTLADISHTSGLVASGVVKNPFKYVDIVMTTTHKTLNGPRSALIFYKKEFENSINFSVFPHVQGGPHNNKIAAVAVQLKKVKTAEFKEYANNVVKNAKALCEMLRKQGFDILTGGTDTHLILWSLKNLGLTGDIVEKVCENSNITVNKNIIIGDTNPRSCSGVRLGTSALTNRGLKTVDFEKISKFLGKAVKISQTGVRKYSQENFYRILCDPEKASKISEITRLKTEVERFISRFPVPGIDS